MSGRPGRLDKIALLADLLGRVPSGEVEIAVAFLGGSPRQGRIGVGPALLRAGWPDDAPREPGLELAEVDRAFARIARASALARGHEGIMAKALDSS